MQNRHHIIVDGYNLILRGNGISAENESGLEQARHLLLRKLDNYRSGKNIVITVVFDGQTDLHAAKSPAPSGIHILFSRPPQKADHIIVKLLEQESQAGNATLVTSDQSLAALARSMGCNHMTVEHFIKKITAARSVLDYNEKYDPPQSQKEIEQWLKIFDDHNIDDNPALPGRKQNSR